MSSTETYQQGEGSPSVGNWFLKNKQMENPPPKKTTPTTCEHALDHEETPTPLSRTAQRTSAPVIHHKVGDTT